MRFLAHRALPGFAAGLVCVLAPVTLRAEPVSTVVELFTSQGCTACRAVDPVMRDLAHKPGVLALTLPVTYWDYLGWRDTLGLRTLNERQRAYSRSHGVRQVATPEAVVNGGATAIGANRAALDRLVQDMSRAATLSVPVRAEVQGNRIVVEIGARAGAKPEPRAECRNDVWLVPLLRHSDTTVPTGDGGARVAAYVNVVRGLQKLGVWNGEPERFEIPAAAAAVGDADSWVVLVQHAREGRLGQILGAAKGPGL